MKTELIGYADKLSVAPGERIRFMVSTDLPSYDVAVVRLIHGDENPAGPGFQEEVIETPLRKQYTGRTQTAYTGSYILVDHRPDLVPINSLTLQAWIYPTTPQKGGPQGLLTKWSQTDGIGYALCITSNGDLELRLRGSNGSLERVRTGKPLRASQWCFVAAAYDPDRQAVRLYQLPLSNWSLEDSAAVVEQSVQAQGPLQNEAPLLIAAAYTELAGNNRVIGRGLYNGKIDSPRVFARALQESEIDQLRHGVPPEVIGGNDLIADWDFAADISSSKVTDRGPYHLHGAAVNMPARAMTGFNWANCEFDYKHALNEFGAIYFHDDDLEDARWEPDFELEIPAQVRSGYYAVRLKSGEHEDHIPFFVRPPQGQAVAPILFLAPTMTYLAYANHRIELSHNNIIAVSDRELHLDPLDVLLAEHPEYGKSIYDLHSDGSGVSYSSWRRPIVSMRPKYRYWLEGGPRHLGGDLYMIDWLEQKGFAYGVATDSDLHREGRALLSNYRVVITGTHPEYWTSPMLMALEDYLRAGGRVMYLGGNGFYWVTSVDPERSHLIEVRRGLTGTRDWSSQPGECYHSTTGEMGGLWRQRGKAPNKIVGIGFTGMGWDGRAGWYERKPASLDPRAAFIFEGVGEGEPIGNFGLVLGGAAGDELDRADFALGTPPHTLVVASSTGHSKLILPVIEDYNQINAAFMLNDRPNVRADMIYFESPDNGAVFSTGSITWCGSLSHNHYDNNVSRITENVLRRFST